MTLKDEFVDFIGVAVRKFGFEIHHALPEKNGVVRDEKEIFIYIHYLKFCLFFSKKKKNNKQKGSFFVVVVRGKSNIA